jgi:hypothetical protein
MPSAAEVDIFHAEIRRYQHLLSAPDLQYRAVIANSADNLSSLASSGKASHALDELSFRQQAKVNYKPA